MADIIYRVFRKPYAISSISRTSNVVTVQISSAHDNLTVGDKIVIYGVTTSGLNTPADDHEVITHVDSSTQFRYTRAGSDESDTDGYAGGHYGADSDGFIDWEATEGRDLTAADEIEFLEIYNDWATGFECNDDCLIDSFTTDSTRYVELNVPIGQRHLGYAKDSGGNYTGFCCYADAGFYGKLFYLQDAYTKIRGFICDGKSQTNAGGINAYGGGTNDTIEDCIAINFDGGGASVNGFGIHGYTHISNCECHDCADGFYIYNYATDCRVYYCSAIDCTINAFSNQNDNGTGMKLSNCRADNSTGSDFVWTSGYNPIVQYCASSDDTADDEGGSGNRINQTFTYVDAPNKNYMISSADAGAKDYGENLGSDPVYPISDDINGVTRPQGNATDIGHNEVIVLGHPVNLRATDVKGMRQWQPQTGRFLR